MDIFHDPNGFSLPRPRASTAMGVSRACLSPRWHRTLEPPMGGRVFLCSAPEPSTGLLTPRLPWLHWRGCECLSDGGPLHGSVEQTDSGAAVMPWKRAKSLSRKDPERASQPCPGTDEETESQGEAGAWPRSHGKLLVVVPELVGCAWSGAFLPVFWGQQYRKPLGQ